MLDITCKINQIYKRIFHIQYKNQYMLMSSFMRLQEFYESPLENIRGKFFKTEQFMDEYVDQYDKFDYYSKWNGTNVSSKVIQEFINIFYYDLNVKEKSLINIIINKIPNWNTENFYLIGTCDDISSFEHEISHGLYYVDNHYHNLQFANMHNIHSNKILKTPMKLEKQLLELGYCKEVIIDESIAYLSTAKKYSDLEEVGLNKEDFDNTKIFRDTFEQFYNKMR